MLCPRFYSSLFFPWRFIGQVGLNLLTCPFLVQLRDQCFKQPVKQQVVLARTKAQWHSTPEDVQCALGTTCVIPGTTERHVASSIG